MCQTLIAATLGVTGEADAGVLLRAEGEEVGDAGLVGNLVQGVVDVMAGGTGHDRAEVEAVEDVDVVGQAGDELAAGVQREEVVVILTAAA